VIFARGEEELVLLRLVANASELQARSNLEVLRI